MPSVDIAKFLRLNVSGLLSLVAICGAPRASAQSQGFCYIQETSASDPYNGNGKPTYFTAIITAADKDQFMRGLFTQCVEKKYSPKYVSPPYCVYLVGGNLQQQIASVKQHGGTAVMTDWTPAKHQALMAEAEAGRRSAIENERRNPKRAIVELR